METRITIANVQLTPSAYKRYRLTGVKRKPQIKMSAIDKQKFLEDNQIGWYTYLRLSKLHDTKDIDKIKKFYAIELENRRKAKLQTYQEQIEAIQNKASGLDIKARNHNYVNKCKSDDILKEYNAKKDTIIRLITDLEIQQIKLNELKEKYESKYNLAIF